MKIVAQGSGWRVHRLGRSSCVQIDRDGEPAEIWVQGQASDVTRGAMLGALLAGAYGDVPRSVAIEAMGADW